jgi:2-isopropylmalate synthase
MIDFHPRLGGSRDLLERRYRQLGYELPDGTIAKLYLDVAGLAGKNGEILDEDLLALLHERFHDAPERYRLTHLHVRSGTTPATADVRLAGPWPGERGATASGSGPVAAAFTAIGAIVGRRVEVLSLVTQSITPGRDDPGQVLLRARIDGKSLRGHGASTDVVEGSARALLHVLSKADHADRLEEEWLNSMCLWGV